MYKIFSMISILIVLIIVFSISSLYGFPWINNKDDITGLSEILYQYSAIDINGNTVTFEQFKGKYILIVIQLLNADLLLNMVNFKNFMKGIKIN